MTMSVVILAAGLGKRMYSTIPKVLQPLAGKPLLHHVIVAAQSLAPEQIIIVTGHGREQVQQQFPAATITWVEQSQQLGTGHAVQQALPAIDQHANVLILAGDVPLITPASLQRLLTQVTDNSVGVLTATVRNPFGLGRILRNAHGEVTAIVEEKDATDAQKAIAEINSGIFCVPAKLLQQFLPDLKNNNAQQEYYLTDIVRFAVAAGIKVTALPVAESEILGINTMGQLAVAERAYQVRVAEKLLAEGVRIADPARFDCRGELRCGRETAIDINVVFEGNVSIGEHCIIEPNCILRNVSVGSHVHIKANSVIDTAQIADHCEIGPFARIRPETVLAEHVKVGNFVEVKKSTIGYDSKVSHLSYIGDTWIGKNVNVGAGTITCNYDGVNKHKTIIEDEAFIGSDTQLVAPVTIGRGATIGAGTTVTKDAPAEALTLSRVAQVTIKGWRRPKKRDKQT